MLKKNLLLGAIILNIGLMIALLKLSLMIRETRAETAGLSQAFNEAVLSLKAADAKESELKAQSSALKALVATKDLQKSPRAVSSHETPNYLASDLFSDPQYFALASTFFDGVVRERYIKFIRNLKISPETEAKLRAILTDKIMAGYDVKLAMKSAGIDPDNPSNIKSRSSILAASDAEFKNQIKQLVGEDNLKNYERFESTAAIRPIIDALELRLSYTSDRLPPDALQNITEKIADSVPSRFDTLTGEQQTAILNSVEPTVSGAALTALRQILEEQSAGKERAKYVNSWRLKSKGKAQ